MDPSESEDTTTTRGRGRKSATPPQPPSINTVVLGPRDVLVGTLTVEGDVRVEGKLEGEVKATGEIAVQASGSAHAQIEARDVSIRGSVEGDIVAHDRLSVGGPGIFKGTVRASRLRIDDGATVNATLTVRPGSAGNAPDPEHAAEPDEHTDSTAADLTGVTPVHGGYGGSEYAHSYDPSSEMVAPVPESADGGVPAGDE